MKDTGLEGIEDVYKKFDKLALVSGSNRLEDKFLRIAKFARRNVRNKINAVVRKKTGNLERGIVAKKFKKKNFIASIYSHGRIIKDPAAFVAIDYRIGPHAHLIELGHAVVRFGKIVGQAPARPFFRPTIESLRSQIKIKIAKAIHEEIMRETKHK